MKIIVFDSFREALEFMRALRKGGCIASYYPTGGDGKGRVLKTKHKVIYENSI